ncbi:polyhydroxyalkanoate depolymerase [Marinobacter sp. CHS3-4]|uniref:polyhydroxyalkanoate depolymerase n=1 Tax=Marinobacter sp. CHS3-4 TaxID=3045174 RepID=UPI0024B5C3FD|nr:polyhydroxyalkanoate depolymerase [Marinobacter sp. CHS3-4]MDI9246722.1 polyhydroxyalkanoate depolymerase [Marinobacter sp. CHS3-4]
MLYAFYELQHAAMAPVHLWADQSAHLIRHPLNPMGYTLAGRTAAAGCEMIEQLTRRYGKPSFGLHKTVVEGESVSVQPRRCHRKTFGQLLHFERACKRDDPRLLIVAPMSGHFATLLRGTVEELLPDHDIYITDWRDARDVPLHSGRFDLDDYVGYLMDWLTQLGPDTHVLAVCQPAVPVYAAACLMEAQGHPAKPASMTLMGGPIDTRQAPTKVNELAMTRPLSWFERNVITEVPPPNLGFMRRVYPGFLQLAGFMTMNLDDHVLKHQKLFKHLITGDEDSAEKTRAFYEEYRSVMDITAEFYLQTIDLVFQRQALARGEWVWHGEVVDPLALRQTPVLAIEGELDDISGVGQTRAALDLAVNLPESRREYFLAEGVGHYGIFNGSKWRRLIAPQVRRFIRRHSSTH